MRDMSAPAVDTSDQDVSQALLYCSLYGSIEVTKRALLSDSADISMCQQLQSVIIRLYSCMLKSQVDPREYQRI